MDLLDAPKLELTNDEKTWGALAHFSAFLGFFVPIIGFLAPLVVLLIKGKESEFVRQNAVNAINFQISILILSLIFLFFTIITFGFLGIIFFPLLYILEIVGILSVGIAANSGKLKEYFFQIKLLK